MYWNCLVVTKIKTFWTEMLKLYTVEKLTWWDGGIGPRIMLVISEWLTVPFLVPSSLPLSWHCLFLCIVLHYIAFVIGAFLLSWMHLERLLAFGASTPIYLISFCSTFHHQHHYHHQHPGQQQQQQFSQKPFKILILQSLGLFPVWDLQYFIEHYRL